MSLVWPDDQTQRIAKGVDGDMELCRQAAPTAANGAIFRPLHMGKNESSFIVMTSITPLFFALVSKF
jgi:hypothetical protein